MTTLEILFSDIPVLAVSGLYLLSCFVGFYFLVQQVFVFVDVSVKAQIHIAVNLVLLTLLTCAEWASIVLMFQHGGFEHGWLMHLVDERSSITFGLFALFNCGLGWHMFKGLINFEIEE